MSTRRRPSQHCFKMVSQPTGVWEPGRPRRANASLHCGGHRRPSGRGPTPLFPPRVPSGRPCAAPRPPPRDSRVRAVGCGRSTRHRSVSLTLPPVNGPPPLSSLLGRKFYLCTSEKLCFFSLAKSRAYSLYRKLVLKHQPLELKFKQKETGVPSLFFRGFEQNLGHNKYTCMARGPQGTPRCHRQGRPGASLSHTAVCPLASASVWAAV